MSLFSPACRVRRHRHPRKALAFPPNAYCIVCKRRYSSASCAVTRARVAVAMAYASRPLVSVISTKTGESIGEQVKLPQVFLAPIRPDVVQIVHTGVAKNARQPYGVSRMAGEWATAHSWGTGRAVSRAPRVHGGGTHRSGQVSGANFARGARMFAPTRIWRRWHVKVSRGQRRYAVASALAASALPALVMSRGHRIDSVPELPLVLSEDSESLRRTKDAVALLKAIGAYEDVEHAAKSKNQRAGRGKMRNRRYTMRRGPLIIYANSEKDPKSGAPDNLSRAFRNLPGVECCHVERLNLLQLAPGGHLGRFCIFTKQAFERLDEIYATGKSGFKFPRAVMTQADLSRIINSDEVQSALRPIRRVPRLPRLKRNALRNRRMMRLLNPAYDAFIRKMSERVPDASRRLPASERARVRAIGKRYIRQLLDTNPTEV
jgi:large subunit ribosomal protein L4e